MYQHKNVVQKPPIAEKYQVIAIERFTCYCFVNDSITLAGSSEEFLHF